MAKENKKETVKNNNGSFLNVIINIGLLLAVISIAYSTTVIVIGTEGWIPKVMLLPQVILGSWIAIKKFTKQGE